MPTGYKVRALSLQRRLPTYLTRSMLEILEEVRVPMKYADLLARLERKYRRFDPEFQRQVRLNLRDGVNYGIWRCNKDLIILRPQNLGMLMAILKTVV